MPSIVWKFFERGKDVVKCIKCGHTHPFRPGSSTSNMLRHVQNNHQLEYAAEAEKCHRPGKRSYSTFLSTQAEPDDVVIHSSSTSSSKANTTEEHRQSKVPRQDVNEPTTTCLKQETLPKSIGKVIPYKITSQKKKKLDELVLDLITEDIQPLSVVENRAFRRFVHELDPRYEIISRKCLTYKLLPKRYNEEKDILMSKLAAVDSVSITTDQWTSKAHEGYTTITGHYIDDKWNMHSPVLMTRAKPQRHTGVNLANELEAAFEEFKIEDKITAVVTDNAANVKCAVSRLGRIEDGQSCFAHTLNLCVKHAIEEHPSTQEAIKTVRQIVTFFNQSTNAMDDLREEHQCKQTKFYKLKKDVETRWNSIYFMLESFKKQRIQVSTVLTKHEKSIPTQKEVKVIDEALVVLKPFFDVTKEMSSEKYTSISKVIPIVKILTKFLDTKASPLGSKLKKQIQLYFSDVESEKFSLFSTFLDPRFKGVLLSDAAKESVIKEVGDFLEKMASPIIIQTEEKKKPEKKKSEEPNFWDDFDEEREQEKTDHSGKSAIDIEISRYLECSLCPRQNDPFAWWRENEVNYPNIAKVAKTYLAIPATSVPSERIFSKAGEIVSARRASIKSKNVDMILFLNKVSRHY